MFFRGSVVLWFWGSGVLEGGCFGRRKYRDDLKLRFFWWWWWKPGQLKKCFASVMNRTPCSRKAGPDQSTWTGAWTVSKLVN
jgi:hypothetical protein